jgi:hypothetical protein
MRFKINLFFWLFSIVVLTVFIYGANPTPNAEINDIGLERGINKITLNAVPGFAYTLYLNGNYVDKIDLIGEPKIIELSGTTIFPDFDVSVGTDVTFKNVGETPYNISFSTGGGAESYPLAEFSTYFTDVGEVTYIDKNTETIQGKITVNEDFIEMDFEGIGQHQLKNGQNEIVLSITPILPNLFGREYDDIKLSFDYDKYPVTLSIVDVVNVTKDATQINGTVSTADVDLFYTVNIDVLEDISQGIPINDYLSGHRFEIEIRNLVEGKNTIRFFTVNKNTLMVNGENWVTVIKDTQPPFVNIKNVTTKLRGKDTLINYNPTAAVVPDNKLVMSIETDAENMTVKNTKTNQTEIYRAGEDIIDNKTIVELSLVDGKNPYVFYAVDKAGNLFKEAHNIFYSTEGPKVIMDSLEPEELFSNKKESHFPYHNVKGQTNNPNVEVNILVISESMKSAGVSCTEFKNKWNSMVDERVTKAEETDVDQILEWEDLQVSFNEVLDEINDEYDFSGSISSLFTDIGTTSNENGDFEKAIILKEASLDDSRAGSSRVGQVSSNNEICFITKDASGRINSQSTTVKLDMGNTCWKQVGGAQTTPNTLYSAEIKQAKESTVGNDGVRFSVVQKFSYVCGGTPNLLESFSVKIDNGYSKESKFMKVVDGEIRAMIDPADKKTLIAYIPINIKGVPDSIESQTNYENWEDIFDNKNQVDVGLAARISYRVDNKEVAIDSLNPIFFSASINIESPFDHTKWLTPEMLDGGIDFLNKSIEITEDAMEYTQYGILGGVAYCTVRRIMFAAKAKKTEDDYRSLFKACDRVVCLPSPDECEGNFDFSSDNGVITVAQGDNILTKEELQGRDPAQTQILSPPAEDGQRTRLAQFETLNIGKECNLSGGKEGKGVLVSGQVTQYEQESVGVWTQTSESGSKLFKDICAPVQTDNSGNRKINLQAASGVCYQEGPTRYDDTKCWFPGLGSAAGYNPKDNILESIRCGCITSTYSHLKNLLKVQKEIRSCLQSAKIGDVEGSYCERLLATAVCDVATNVIFKTLNEGSSVSAGELAADQSRANDPKTADPSFIEGMREGDRELNERYDGTWYSNAGFGTQDLAHKVCLIGITGDWSTLADNILSAAEEDEIKPTIGPAFPVSRIQGYDPLTGSISIMYRFTHAVVSGGQVVTTKISFKCDKTQSGAEFCPEGEIVEANTITPGIPISTLLTGEDRISQDTITITDNQAKYRYNVLVMEHTYELDGVKKTVREEFEIKHKDSGLLAQCDFTASIGAGAGFKCDSIYSDAALSSQYALEPQGTHIVPMDGARPVLYSYNPLVMYLKYDIRGKAEGDQKKAKLYYKISCTGASAYGYREVDIHRDPKTGNAIGHTVEKIIDIPAFGEKDALNYYQGTLNVNNEKFSSWKGSDGTYVESIRVEPIGKSPVTQVQANNLVVMGKSIDGSYIIGDGKND